MPDRLPLADVAPLDLVALGALHFEAPDLERFPALGLARAALRAGGTAAAVLNAANEEAVAAFLAGRIGFPAIASTAAEVLERMPPGRGESIEEIVQADREARGHACRIMEEWRTWA
jgi:1-deoxy-D-xylulose-5-phosphate reductoisomerase